MDGLYIFIVLQSNHKKKKGETEMYPYNAQQPFYTGQITRVNGENGARAFNMMPNSSAILLDEHDPLIWLCLTDGAGYKTIKPYTITEYVPEPQPDYNAMMQRIARLEEMISNGKSNNSDARSKRTESGADGVKYDAGQ